MQRPRLLHCVPLIASLMIWPNLSTNSHIRVHTLVTHAYMHTCVHAHKSQHSWKHSTTVMEKINAVNGFSMDCHPACHCGPPHYPEGLLASLMVWPNLSTSSICLNLSHLFSTFLNRCMAQQGRLTEHRHLVMGPLPPLMGLRPLPMGREATTITQ